MMSFSRGDLVVEFSHKKNSLMETVWKFLGAVRPHGRIAQSHSEYLVLPTQYCGD